MVSGARCPMTWSIVITIETQRYESAVMAVWTIFYMVWGFAPKIYLNQWGFTVMGRRSARDRTGRVPS